MSRSSRKRGRNLKDDTCDGEPSKKQPMLDDVFLNTSVKPAPFSHDEEARTTRKACDYSIRITMEDAKANRASRPVRVYADGIYDMFHNGHARQLMQAKCLLPNAYLIVGVCNQELTEMLKGRTVMNEYDRYDAVRHCRYVDELHTDAPWLITDDFLEENKIDFVAHDDLPYGAEGDDDIYKTIKERGMFLATKRTEGISTTDIIANILKDYDLYARRNLSKGYTAKQMNIGFMKEKKIMFGEKYDRWVDKGKELRKEFIDKGQEIIQKWERNSKEFISNFLEVFSKDGRLSSWLLDSKTRVVRAMSPTTVLSDSPGPSHSRTPSPERDVNGSIWDSYLYSGSPTRADDSS